MARQTHCGRRIWAHIRGGGLRQRHGVAGCPNRLRYACWPPASTMQQTKLVAQKAQMDDNGDSAQNSKTKMGRAWRVVAPDADPEPNHRCTLHNRKAEVKSVSNDVRTSILCGGDHPPGHGQTRHCQIVPRRSAQTAWTHDNAGNPTPKKNDYYIWDKKMQKTTLHRVTCCTHQNKRR